MPDTPQPPSTPDKDQDGFETDTFSRNDQEGRPGPDLKLDEKALAAGEEGDYATDTFSRNDDEGAPGLETAAGDDSDGLIAETTPDALKASDDADSRDATPPPAEGHGIR